MDAEKSRALFQELDRFFTMVEDRAASIKVQFEAARSLMDAELIPQLDKGVKQVEDTLKYIRRAIVDIDRSLEILTVTDEDVERLYEDVDSLSALYKAKKLQLSIIHDQIKARKAQLH